MNINELIELARSIPPSPCPTSVRIHSHGERVSLSEFLDRRKNPPTSAEAFTGLPIYVDPSVPRGVLRFEHEDGRIEDVRIT